MSRLLLPAPVLAPALLRHFNVVLLPLLGPAREQDDDLGSLAPVVDALFRARSNPDI
jgi:hypothetical protein